MVTDENGDADNRNDELAKSLRFLRERPDRPFEPWERADYRTYWPKLKRIAIGWDAISASLRVIAVVGGVFVAMYGVRDLISAIVGAVVKSFGHG